MAEIKAEKKEKKETKQENINVYEIGFHLTPSLSEEEVEKEVGFIKKVIEDAGGVFVSEGYPKMQNLEYTIVVPISMPKARFNVARFGWIKFEGTTEALEVINESLSRNDNILRMLVTKTTKENTLYGAKLKQKKEAEERREEEAKKASEAPKVSDEEIDKSIEDIIV